MEQPRFDPEVTRLLAEWREGDPSALARLVPLIYDELRKLAGAYYAREREGLTLQPTALINEAYLRLVDQSLPAFRNRSHFYGVAAQLMRQILVDFARQRRALRRGGGQNVEVTASLATSLDSTEELLAAHQALERLAQQDPRKARVIELKYFGGLEREEIAEALGLTVATVKHDLLIGKAWLRRELSSQLPA